LYTPIFGEEAAIELPNDEMCINFGLEWLGRTPGARACSEKESAREQRDVALQGKGRVRGVQKERVAKEWPWRARSAGQPKHGEQDHSGTGQPQIPGFQETVGPDPTQPGPLYTGYERGVPAFSYDLAG
jgi:hypothetical protein